MRNVYLFQPQFTVEVRKEDNYWLPYSAACLWSYCNQFEDIKSNYEFKEIFFKREHPDEVLKRIDNPVVCGFSCFVWNVQYNLHIAKLIKEKYPNCIIEFGGPQTTKTMLEENDFIDCVQLGGDGEPHFLDLLRRILNGDEIQKVYERERITDLNFPSPYQAGVFNKLVEDNPDTIWAAILETNRGCPHMCTYCDWGGTTYSRVNKFDLTRVEDDLDWIMKHKCAYLFCIDANFGIFRERDLKIAQMLRDAADNPISMIEDIVVQDSKNGKSGFEISHILGEYDRRGVTVSVQSMNMPTLTAIKRQNLKMNDIANHMKLAKQWGVQTYTELILGLPEETFESWREGFTQLLEAGQHYSIDVWFCQVFGNTELNSQLSREMYGIGTVTAEDYISFSNKKDFQEVKETIELINKTNTLSTEDLVKCYLYSWMIVQFHINGYSQWIAKYYRTKLNISYRKFYDHMFDKILTNTGHIGKIYKNLYNRIYSYMTTGKVAHEDDRGHKLEMSMATERGSLFEYREETFEFVKECVDSLEGVDSDLFLFQKEYVYNPEVNYPLTMKIPFDIENDWEDKDTCYEVCNDRPEEMRHNTWMLIRRGFMKNTIVKK